MGLENYWSLCLPPSALGLGWTPNGGICERHSNAQVSKAGDQYSGRCPVINYVPFSLRCVLFILF